MSLSFTIAADPRQRSNSPVRVLRGSWPHFTVSDSRLPQPGGPGSRTYIPQEQGGPIVPQALGSLFIASCDSQGYGWGIRPRLHPGRLQLKSKSKLVTTDGQSPSLSWCQAHYWDLRPDFFLPDSCGFVDMVRPLWREGGPAFYNVQCAIYLHSTCYGMNVYKIYARLLSVQALVASAYGF
jgi:hypothetical protein